MQRSARPFLIAACALLAGTPPCAVGPPFLTDDPVPVDFGHNEFYVFGTLDHADGTSAIAGPAIEYNRGIAPETQFHIVVPEGWNVPAHGSVATGVGDIELGIKYRFVNATAGGLQVGIFPMVEIATGSARRGLGNGRTWYRLPLWVQKSEGAWTFNGGGGVIVNPAAGMMNATFGGVLAQYTFSPRWTLGTEVFRQNALTAGQPGYTLLNAGGYLNFSQNFSVLFSAGASVAGARAGAGLDHHLQAGPVAGLGGFLAMWRDILVRSDFHVGCPVMAVAVEEPMDDIAEEALQAAAQVFGDWESKLLASLVAQGHERESAAELATLIIASVEGAIVLSRAMRSITPFNQVARQLERLVSNA